MRDRRRRFVLLCRYRVTRLCRRIVVWLAPVTDVGIIEGFMLIDLSLDGGVFMLARFSSRTANIK